MKSGISSAAVLLIKSNFNGVQKNAPVLSFGDEKANCFSGIYYVIKFKCKIFVN